MFSSFNRDVRHNLTTIFKPKGCRAENFVLWREKKMLSRWLSRNSNKGSFAIRRCQWKQANFVLISDLKVIFVNGIQFELSTCCFVKMYIDSVRLSWPHLGSYLRAHTCLNDQRTLINSLWWAGSWCLLFWEIPVSLLSADNTESFFCLYSSWFAAGVDSNWFTKMREIIRCFTLKLLSDFCVRFLLIRRLLTDTSCFCSMTSRQ